MKTIDQKIALPSDEELIQKILGGETAFFEVLIRRYNSLLYKIARTYGLIHQDAEDMMQETHVAAYQQLAKFRGDSSYKTWITRIMLNKCYHKTHYGSLKYEREAENETHALIETAAQDADRIISNKELGGILEKSLAAIPLPYRSVFIFREIEAFSVAETAELLHITPTNVKVRLNRAKAMLQKQVENYYSAAEIFEFNLIYCDGMVKRVFEALPGGREG